MVQAVSLRLENESDSRVKEPVVPGEGFPEIDRGPCRNLHVFCNQVRRSEILRDDVGKLEGYVAILNFVVPPGFVKERRVGEGKLLYREQV